MKNNWKLEKLGDICEFINGKGHEKLIDEDGDYIVVNSKFVSSNGKVFKKSKSQLLPLLKNDIVLVMSDVPNGKTIAKCFKIEENNKYTLNQRVCSLRTNKIDIDFLFKQLNRNQYFLEFDNGENQTNLRKNDVLNCPILIPPLEEQQTIVAKLDQAFAAIEQAKANIEKNISNAKELFQSKLNQIFSQKGDGWEERTLQELCEKITDGSHNPPKGIEKSEYLMLSSKNVFDDSINFDNPRYLSKEDYLSENKRTDVKENDILLTIVGTVGRVAVVPKLDDYFVLQRSVAVLKPIPSLINSRFLKYVLRNAVDFLQENARGVAQKGIYLNQLKKVSVNVPNLIDQQNIVNQLDQLQEQTNLLVTKYQQKLANLEELKKSILEKAFKGELV